MSISTLFNYLKEKKEKEYSKYSSIFILSVYGRIVALFIVTGFIGVLFAS